MKFFLRIVCLVCISQNIFGEWIEWIPYDDGLSYQDLININGSCFPRDSCMQYRTDDPMVPFEYMCSCNTRCWEIGTCCIDSPYRVNSPIQKCRNDGHQSSTNGYYMVFRCPDYTYSDSIWKNLCEKEWSGEDDLLMLSPVTSFETSLTYKNYYCFKCNEVTDKYLSWNLLLQSIYNTSEENREYSVTYDHAKETWMATLDDDHVSIPVNLSFQYPFGMEVNPTRCNPGLISNCPHTWTEESVRDKCLAYTAVVYQGFTSYKNVHCALCNYVSLDSLTCRQTGVTGYGFKDIFSFKHLLNINSDGDKVGNDEKCDNGQVWDPYAKKCRKTSCAIPTYVIQDNRCVAP